MTRLIPPAAGRPYATFVADDAESPLAIPEADFIDAYKRYGALLLSGFALDLDAFSALTRRYCSSSVFNESGGRELLDASRNIQTVNLGTEEFPLHPELSREPWKPDICFFWCVKPPARGGETTVCDGVDLVKQLPEPARAALQDRRIRYTQLATPEACAYWLGAPDPDDAVLARPPAGCPYQFFRVNGQIARTFTQPMLHKPMFCDDVAFGNFLLFGRYHNGVRKFPTFADGAIVPDDLLDQVKAVGDRLAAPIAWREGDVVVLDNTRFMHGRRPILDAAERRIATYFGYVKFAELDAAQRDAPWRRGAFRPP